MLLNAHVDSILVRDGRAAGVQLSSGERVTAKKAVVSNASLWDQPAPPPGRPCRPQQVCSNGLRYTHAQSLHSPSLPCSCRPPAQQVLAAGVVHAACDAGHAFQGGGLQRLVMHLLHDAGDPSVPLLHAPALWLPGRGDGRAGAAPHRRQQLGTAGSTPSRTSCWSPYPLSWTPAWLRRASTPCTPTSPQLSPGTCGKVGSSMTQGADIWVAPLAQCLERDHLG